MNRRWLASFGVVSLLSACALEENEVQSESMDLRARRGLKIVVTGDPAKGPYAVGAETTATRDVRIELFDNGTLRGVEHDAPYCLTPEREGACMPSTLGAGSHVITAVLYPETGTTELARASVTIVEGTGTVSPIPTTTAVPTSTGTTPPPPPPPPPASNTPAPWPVPTGTVLYVSPNGADANDGSANAPFRTIGRAAKAVKPGMTVLLADGDYAENVVLTVDGTATQPITFLAKTRGGARVHGGSTDTGWWTKSAYTSVVGIEVDGSDAPSWRVGIYSTGAHSSVKYCEVHDILRDASAFASAEASHSGGGAILGDNWYGHDDINLIGNLVYAVGPSSKSSSLVHGIYQTAAGTVANNVIVDTVGDGITSWHDAHDIRMVNNTIYGARGTGILVGAGDSGILGNPISARAGDYFTLANNVVVGCKYGIGEYGQIGSHNQYFSNIVYGSTVSNVSLKNGGTGTATLLVDPLFMNPAARDFRLKVGSPAIDAANATYAPADDFQRLARPLGAAADRGAVESY